ncbi:hypothetical protein D9599_26365 [Roseomonas sp. KE2513]|uniref:hypothetical protein n=1 Tax=Roseomonas sp. KE2513 TaxID=2479202 RepID=UPI0018E0071E|nr:hypothetical protein [Roseomonas sp. KE2513]MBI0539074.1 hypothetical protein [Roseomonas sp. KE2513]
MFSGGQASETSGSGTHLAAPALVTHDEAMRMRPDLQLLLRSDKRSLLARKLRHFADYEFSGMADQ